MLSVHRITLKYKWTTCRASKGKLFIKRNYKFCRTNIYIKLWTKIYKKYMFCILCSTLISLIILPHDIHPSLRFATPYNSLSPSGFSDIWYDMTYLLPAILFSPGGRNTVHFYIQTIDRKILSKQDVEQHKNFGRVRTVPRLG